MWEMGLYSAVAPLILLLLSSLWSYPAVLEEVVKWGILRAQILDARREMLGGVVVGVVFGLSEAVLFSLNAWSGGQWSSMGTRLLLTVPMHIVTATIIAYAISKRMGVVGVVIAMIIHGGFNYWLR